MKTKSDEGSKQLAHDGSSISGHYYCICRYDRSGRLPDSGDSESSVMLT